MSKNMKIIIISGIIFVILGILVGFSIKTKNKNDDGRLKVVTTTFSTYDFARQILNGNAEVTLLLEPGTDTHSYEPSAGDLIKIKNADVFIYIGGEMEQWVEKVLETDTINNENTMLRKVTDSVAMIEEQEVDGAEEDDDEEGTYDSHIWTSPSNAIKMVEYLNTKFASIDSNNKEEYQKNTDEYVEKIKVLRTKISEIVNNKKRNRLVFGDKMPMQYFLNEFNLTASAAFSGCSTEAEPGTKTITYLVNKVREEKIPVVLYIELSTGKTAKAIASETETKAMQIQTLHNISKDDFINGETYVSLMTKNLDVLKEALQ